MHLLSDMKVLLVNTGSVADSLMMLPVIQTLYPRLERGRLDLMVSPVSRELLGEIDGISRVLSFTPGLRWWKHVLFTEIYDVAIVYGRNKHCLQFARKKSRYTIGEVQQEERLNRLLDSVVPSCADGAGHVSERYGNLLAPLQLSIPDARLTYPVLPKYVQQVDKWLRKQKAQDRAYIGIGVSNTHGESYVDWPLERITEFISGISARWPDLNICLFGEKNGGYIAEQLTQKFPGKILNTVGKLSLPLQVALLPKMQLFVGVDGDMTCLASAVSCPLVSLFPCHRRSNQWHRPGLGASEVVDHPALIARRESPMSEVSASSVILAVEKLVRRLPDNKAFNTDW